MKIYHDLIIEALISLYDKKAKDVEFEEELTDLVDSLKTAKYIKTSHEIKKCIDLLSYLGREKSKEPVKKVLENALGLLNKEAEGII
jgi:hypothetical protein